MWENISLEDIKKQTDADGYLSSESFSFLCNIIPYLTSQFSHYFNISETEFRNKLKRGEVSFNDLCAILISIPTKEDVIRCAENQVKNIMQ